MAIVKDRKKKPIHVEDYCTCGAKIVDFLDAFYPMDRTFTRWNAVCDNHNGGCGRIVYGSTYEEIIIRWNKGEVDEYFID